MRFKDNEFLSGPELRDRLEISRNNWEKYRLKILEDLKLYCDFEVLGKGNRLTYHIIHQFSAYEKFSPRNSKEKNNKIYTKNILESVRENSCATYVSITDDIILKPEIQEINHAYGTSYGYTRECTATALGTPDHPQGTHGSCAGRVWSRRVAHRWKPLEGEPLEKLKELLHESFQGIEEEATDILSDEENGIISPEQANKAVKESYYKKKQRAIDKFIDIYGYEVRKVPKYELRAW